MPHCLVRKDKLEALTTIWISDIDSHDPLTVENGCTKRNSRSNNSTQRFNLYTILEKNSIDTFRYVQLNDKKTSKIVHSGLIINRR